MRRQRFHAVRREVAQVQHVARSHHDLRLHRSHLRDVEVRQVDAARRLPPVDAPPLLAGQMNDEHVVGVEVAAIRLVAALREENRCIGERRGASPIERGGERVDVRLEDVESFQHARRAFFEVLLQHAAIDEPDLPLLDQLVEVRARKIDRFAGLEQVQVVQVEQRVVQVPP